MWKFIWKTSVIVLLLALPLIVRFPMIENNESYLFLSALYMTGYFLLPVMKYQSVMLIIQACLLVGLQFFVGDTAQFIIVGLFFFLLLEAIKGLEIKACIVVSVLIMILLIIGQWLVQAPLASFIFAGIATSFFALILWKYKSVKERNEELQSLYESLLIEYRKMKRESNSFAEQARVQERTRIARDIHDSVGHQLTALLMQLEMGKLAVHSQPEVAEMIEAAKEIASHSLQETRRAVKALQSEEPSGIASVIHLIKKLETNNHLKISFTTRNGVLNMKLSNEANIVLYRTIQEALTNAMRHGNGKQIEIALELIAGRSVRLAIKNESKSTGKVHEGFGLTALRERLEQIGGQMSIYKKEGIFYLIGVLPSEENDRRGKNHGC